MTYIPTSQNNGEQAVSTPSVTPDKWLTYSLTNGASTINMKVDGSSVNVNFDYVVPEGKVFIFERVVGYITDATLTMTNFGAAALTNGLLIQIVDSNNSTVLNHFDTDREAIKYLAEFAVLAGVDGIAIQEGGVEPDAFLLRWTVSRAGRAIKLTAGQRIRMVVRDNLLGLDEMRMAVQGIVRDA